MTPLYIDKEKIAALLPMKECIEVMEKMFRSLARGETMQPLRSLLWLPDRSGLMGMMPGYAGGLGVMGIKIISVFHGNAKAGYPSHQGLVVLLDARHGQPLLICDAEEITAKRTAAASAVATSLLSRENSERLAILGTGEQAARHIEAISLVRKINTVTLWGRDHSKTSIRARELSEAMNLPVTACETAAQAVAGADIVCTVTASEKPVLQRPWIAPGTHINAVGACTPRVRELESALIQEAKLYADSYESVYQEAGDFIIPKNEGLITETHVKGEIGEVLTGTRAGRENPEEITVFKSLGIAAEDLFSAWHIYEKSNR